MLPCTYYPHWRIESTASLPGPPAFPDGEALPDAIADRDGTKGSRNATQQHPIALLRSYRLRVVDGQQQYEHARIDEEIFTRLHRSSAVIADTTGARPNCFLELGYALGRGIPTIVTARSGSETPFDITTFSGLRWKRAGSLDERRQAFRQHWQATRTRPPLVRMEGLIP